MIALVAAEKRSPLDDALFRASLLERRVSMLESRLTKTEEAHHDISALLQSQEDRPAGVLPSGAGRSPRQLSEAASCCRWTPDNTCGSVGYACSSMHEFLERKTTTHSFADVDQCLGTADQGKWSWGFDGSATHNATAGTAGVVTLSNDGASALTMPTPLLVEHAADCSAVAPTLTLQLDTVALGSLTVGGFDVGATLLSLTTPPSPPATPP